jgi:catechol 2,3-dioxygenase-like lactoylglutathione lyase family enzyme
MMKKHLRTANTILYCRKWETTVRFYRDGLGLAVLFANDWFVEFALTAGARLSIADESRSSVKSCEKKGITLALEVEDIGAARAYAHQNGLHPTIIERHPWNARVFYLFDPEGHRIEFWEPSKEEKI